MTAPTCPKCGVRNEIMRTLQEEWRFSEGGSSWESFDALAAWINRPRRSVVAEIHRMESDGLVKRSWLYDTDRGVCGSGYLLTNEGERWKP